MSKKKEKEKEKTTETVETVQAVESIETTETVEVNNEITTRDQDEPAVLLIEGEEAKKLNESLTDEHVALLDQGKVLIEEADGEIREASQEETAEIEEILTNNQVEDFKVVTGASDVSPALVPNGAVGELDGAVSAFRFKKPDELKYLEEKELEAYAENCAAWAQEQGLAAELILIVELRGEQNGDFRTYSQNDLALVVESGQHLRVHLRGALVFESGRNEKPTVFIPGPWLEVLVKFENEEFEAAKREAVERKRRRYALINRLYID